MLSKATTNAARPTTDFLPPLASLTRLASSRISITMTEEARAHTGRWIKSGARYCTLNHADTFFLLAVITSRFRLAKHACWNARDYEELVLWLVKNTPIPAAQWIPLEEHVNRRRKLGLEVLYEFLDRRIFIPFRVFDRISSGWTNEWIGAGKDLLPWEGFYFSWTVSWIVLSIYLSFFFFLTIFIAYSWTIIRQTIV